MLSLLFFKQILSAAGQQFRKSTQDLENLGGRAVRVEKTRIPVCWHKPSQVVPGSVEHMASEDSRRSRIHGNWIKEILRKEFSKKRTIVSFYGFSDCPDHNDKWNPNMIRVVKGKIFMKKDWETGEQKQADGRNSAGAALEMEALLEKVPGNSFIHSRYPLELSKPMTEDLIVEPMVEIKRFVHKKNVHKTIILSFEPNCT